MVKWKTEDGWNNEWLREIGFEEMIDHVDTVSYAVRNCVRGTDGMDNREDMIAFLIGLKEIAEEILMSVESEIEEGLK
jgi:hypothetical protein